MPGARRRPVLRTLICFCTASAAVFILERAHVTAQADAAQAAALARLDAFLEARARGWDFLPGEAIVKFKPKMGASGQQRALNALRSRPTTGGLHWIGDRAVVRDETERDARILVQRLREQPEVESAELNYIRRMPATRGPLIRDDMPADSRIAVVPNDPQYGTLQWNFSLIDMPKAWDITPGGIPEVIVAVVDTGITTANSTVTYPLYTGTSIQSVATAFAVNPDLPASRLVSPRDFVFNNNTDVQDMDGHGTHVSGTIAEESNNAIRLAGMAYRVRIMPVKVCLGYWESMIINARAGRSGFLPDDGTICPSSATSEGIRYAADNGAKVINVSLGGFSGATSERDAITYAVSKGAFVSISAGNEFEDGNPVVYPASFAASINGAMAVGAVGKSSTRAFYSSTGSYVEIAAPGGSSRDPGTGDDRGYIWQATLDFPDQAPSIRTPRFDRYASIGYTGTSMAAPHVAGLAALLVSQGVTSPAAIEAIIKATAKDLGAAGKDNDFGYGLIQPRAALFGLGIRK